MQAAAEEQVLDELRSTGRQQFAFRVKVARQEINEFVSLVLRDEKTGKPVDQAWMHERWHELCDVHDRVIIWSHVESGKTSQLGIGRLLFALGKNPNLRVAVVSNTHGQAKKIVRAIAGYIERSQELRCVFPNLKPGRPWSPDSGSITVQRDYISKDPSIQAAGVHGSIVGSRIDYLVVDDILDYENCRTPALRQDTHDWFVSSVLGRLTDEAKVCIIGNAYHPDDMLHKFAANPRWAARVYPVYDDQTGQSRWPEKWPIPRILAKREELGPVEFARQMMCKPRSDEDAKFKREWIDICLRRGDGRALAMGIQQMPTGCKTYTGVDLAVQRHASADLTCLFDVMIHPNGDREVLGIESGRWSGPEIVNRIYDHHRRYMSIAIVENNAAQDFILQFLKHGSAVPVQPFTTGRNKAHPDFGIESMATEMSNGKWIIPNQGGRMHKEVEAWVSECLYYDPSSHTGDRLMASWFAREGARMGTIKAETGPLHWNVR